MRIDSRQISLEGLTFKQEIVPKELDLDTEIIRFSRPINVRAQISKITNAVSVHLSLDAVALAHCSRCLADLEIDLKKDIKLNYPVSVREPIIDLGPDIREEIILDYPVKPLCTPGCKGLCPKCGKNLNESKCGCVY